MNEFAADFIGAANIIHGELIEGPDAHGRARVRTPPLTFSPTELMSLIFSRKLLKPLEGTEIQSALNSALNKAAAALPPQGLACVREMENLFSVGLGPLTPINCL